MTLSIHGCCCPSGPDGQPLDGFDTDPLVFLVSEIQTGDHLFGAREFVVVIQLGGPWRSRAVVDDDQQPARANGPRRPGKDRRPVQPDGGMQELRRDQVEFAVGKAVGQVERDELDAVADAARARRLPGATQRGLGDVDRDDVPAPLGEPHRVGTLTAAQVERPARRQIGRHVGELDIDASAPDPIAFSVVLFPVRLAFRSCRQLAVRPWICQCHLPCRQRRLSRTTSTCGFGAGCANCASSAA